MTRAEVRRAGWIPWTFVGAFVLVLLANGALVYFAASTYNGLTSDDAYAEGLAFNRTLDEAAAQARLGWTIEPSFDGRTFTVRAAARDGTALLGAAVTVDFVRPTQAGFDFQAALPALGDGAYGAAIAFAMPGLWDARIAVARDGHVLRQTRRIVAP